MYLVKFLFAFLSVSAGRLERGWVGIEFRHVKEGIADDITTNAKLVWELANDWTNFLRDWFVFLLHRKKHIGKVGKIGEFIRGSRRRGRSGRMGRMGRCRSTRRVRSRNMINGMKKGIRGSASR
jgi:hypothetical protein